MATQWDIFCTVVDNYGDIGVCWRLARQLVAEHGLTVRLWVDDLAALARLQPEVDASRRAQSIAGVEVRQWTAPFPAAEPAQVVIEAFACEPPAGYVDAMARRSPAPAWINLEYLSAEDWVEGFHGMASPHPRLPLTKRFFFPGFTAATGGLLREGDYRQRHADFAATALRQRLGLPARRENELTVSLFSYENPALPDLLRAWSEGDRPVHCLVPEGRVVPQVKAYLGLASAGPGQRGEQGRLAVDFIPFLPQTEYDALLWLADVNFVRGEDSLVRALWAAKPMIWQIYPQQDHAHHRKLDAFLDLYCAGLPAEIAAVARKFWAAWNFETGPALAWPAYLAALPALANHASHRAKDLFGQTDLATNLVRMAGDKAH